MITARADVVGSLLRPPELLSAQKQLVAGGLTPAEFRRIEDRAVDQAVELLAGRTMVETVVPAGDEGNLLIEVTIDAPGDTFAQNNVNGLIVKVEPSPSIAVVTPQPPIRFRRHPGRHDLLEG